MKLSSRQKALLTLLALAVAGEVAGRWAITQLPLVSRVPARSHDGLDAWPVIVIVAKAGLAIILASVTWRLGRAHRVALAAERLLASTGRTQSRPDITIGLSFRVWAAAFLLMAGLYLVPTSTAELGSGCWPILAPWIHTPALPIFAIIAVLIALVWRTLSRWLEALEGYSRGLQALLRRLVRPLARRHRTGAPFASPRSRFGVSFECRPPPLDA